MSLSVARAEVEAGNGLQVRPKMRFCPGLFGSIQATAGGTL
jgi:hypothetical protein